MFKKEFKSNLKGLIIWSSIMILLFVLVFIIYPSMIKDTEMLSELMASMDEKLLSLFNMDVIGIDSVFGWIATEGYLLILLVGGCYFGIMGSNILLKEENDKTIEFLYSKPIKRNQIITSKILCGLSYIVIFNLLIGLTNLIGTYVSEELDFNKWFLITLLPMFGHLFIYLISILISIFLNKTNQSIGVCLGTLFGFYFLSVLGSLSKTVEFLKYFSPFYYVEARSILLNGMVSLTNIGVLLGSSFVIMLLIYKLYSKKELL